MARLWIVALGGAIGSVARYVLSGAVQRAYPTFFPTGTLAVNLVGCLIVGLVGGLALRPVGLSLGARLFLVTGICGGFTTFSAFGFETFQLLSAGELWQAGVNALVQMVGGLIAVWAGIVVSRLL
jgi:CrcB protein